MTTPIGLALLGSGIFAREQHLPAILSCPSIHLKAIYSRTTSSAASLASSASLDVDIYSSEESINDLEALLKREDISAVIIGLPIPIQPSVIHACLLARKHVLSEKPIAPTIASACELLQFSRPLSALWGVGENYRFQSSWYYARDAIVKFGRILNFNVQVSSMVEGSNRYYHTSWRKTPKYQGGFILDGGVHFVAGLRILLGSEEVKRVAAFSAANMEYLPPVDTVNAVMRTKGGKVGYFALSFGTTMKGFEFTVACEGGVVVVGGGGKVKVTPRGGEETVKDFSEEKNGVEQEVKAFAKAILEGKLDERQTPENALKDLELIEKMLLSGEKDGESMEITVWRYLVLVM
ncbi:hypothetical protein BDD12DRAFT_916357 [Trichophaea hybrida]|nr:hypothetical protein BDD12DRAFT_916357 [Trichophaea hybrida]